MAYGKFCQTGGVPFDKFSITENRLIELKSGGPLNH